MLLPGVPRPHGSLSLGELEALRGCDIKTQSVDQQDPGVWRSGRAGTRGLPEACDVGPFVVNEGRQRGPENEGHVPGTDRGSGGGQGQQRTGLGLGSPSGRGGRGVPSPPQSASVPGPHPGAPNQEVPRETAAAKSTQWGKKADPSLDTKVRGAERGCPGDCPRPPLTLAHNNWSAVAQSP